MTIGEFYFWMAYDQLFPLDKMRRLETMLASILAQLFNVHRGKNQAGHKPDKYLPMYEGYKVVRRPALQPALSAESHLKALFMAWGGEESGGAEEVS